MSVTKCTQTQRGGFHTVLRGSSRPPVAISAITENGSLFKQSPKCTGNNDTTTAGIPADYWYCDWTNIPLGSSRCIAFPSVRVVSGVSPTGVPSRTQTYPVLTTFCRPFDGVASLGTPPPPCLHGGERRPGGVIFRTVWVMQIRNTNVP